MNSYKIEQFTWRRAGRKIHRIFFDEAGYPWKCQQHVQPATHKVLFLSPKGEVEGDFGPKYYCGECVPNIYEVAANQDAYLDVFYGKI